jgi:hypothetical protein
VPQPTTLPRAPQGWHTVNLTCQVMELTVSFLEVSFTYDNLIMIKLEHVDKKQIKEYHNANWTDFQQKKYLGSPNIIICRSEYI